jgi:hypothetical protein
MTKRQDLRLQRRSRPEQSDQRQPNQAANISHQPRASPNSTTLTSRIKFPTMTCEIFGIGVWSVIRLCLHRPLVCSKAVLGGGIRSKAHPQDSTRPPSAHVNGLLRGLSRPSGSNHPIARGCGGTLRPGGLEYLTLRPTPLRSPFPVAPTEMAFATLVGC